jgi:phosphohistidine swiveling domain-containing protein
MKDSNPEQYQRLFRVQGLRYLISDIWMEHYRTLGTLCVFIDDEFTSFLPKVEMVKTLDAGVQLFGSVESYKKFEEDFRSYIEETRSLAETTTSQGLTQENLNIFLRAISKFFYFYSKTEFFYTDKAFETASQENNQEKLQLLNQLGELKNYGREFMNSIFFGGDAYLNKILESLSEKFNVSLEVLTQYSREDLLNLFNDKKVSELLLEERNIAFILEGVSSGLQVIVGDEAAIKIRTFYSLIETREKNVLKGIVANKGNIEGRAFVLVSGYSNFDDIGKLIEKMNQGDILVSETTSPELILACKKASGIITDQGGLMSHAAIVSRELKIPCIVGTGDATKRIATGDLITINGENGVITITK